MRRLRVGILDFLTNSPREPWFQRRVLVPNYSSIMPECVAVWAEEMGHQVFYETYTGSEDLFTCLPDDLDVLFLSCFSRASFLAYAVSNLHRRRGTVTVLGGPHARSFVEHARRYFDYVCQITDRGTIRRIFEELRSGAPGQVLNEKAQPRSLPGARARERYIDHNMRKSVGGIRFVPLIGSLGCPYTCHFCIDAVIPYSTLPYDQIADDLRFVDATWGGRRGMTFVIWHDPNFGVRFKEYMRVIDGSGTKRLMHIAESSMSLLGEDNLKSLHANRFIGMLPGVESWYEFNAKGAQKRNTGRDKLVSVSEHINLIQSYLPYVQANFVLGLDSDAGAEPWELTKEFVRRSPGSFPGFSLVTDFSNAPLSDALHREGRTVHVPYPFLDNNFAMNVMLKNYGPVEFYERLVDMFADVWSYRALARRWSANRHWAIKAINLGRGLSEGRGRLAHHRRILDRLRRDPDFVRFLSGEKPEAPLFYFETLRRELGQYAAICPPELLTPQGFLGTVRDTAPEAKIIPPEKTEVALVA